VEQTVEVTLSALTDIAVETWRIHRWAFVSGYEKDRVVARQASRTKISFLARIGFEICDLAGKPYDPGLAVEIVDLEEDAGAPNASVRIEEMLAPIVLWRGRLIKTGQVVVRRGAPDQEVAT
jgi:hypothetical protein